MDAQYVYTKIYDKYIYKSAIYRYNTYILYAIM